VSTPDADEECTGIAASWCPVHGDCTCPSEHVFEHGEWLDRVLDRNHPQCPLHGSASSHAEEIDSRPAWRADGILAEILDELDRAVVKFPGQHLALGFGPDTRPLPVGCGVMSARELAATFRWMTDGAAEVGSLTWTHVLLEELFEALAEDDKVRARAELLQVAAMCVRAVLDIDQPAPVSFSAPSGRRWQQIGVTSEGRPFLVASNVDVTVEVSDA
jgi:hypothetical protein